MPTKLIENLVVDTSAFINNAQLQEIGEKVITIKDVIDEVTDKRQLRRLVVLPYDIQVKEVFSENIQFVTEFSKKTGDYSSLSTTDIKVIALTYQLEKELVGTEHLKQAPTVQKTVIASAAKPNNIGDANSFFGSTKICEDSLQDDAEKRVEETNDVEDSEDLNTKLESLNFVDEENDDLLVSIKSDQEDESEDESENSEEDSSDEFGWITPANITEVKKNLNSDLVEEKPSVVACVTTDFAMQNVLKQIGLNVAALDGKVIKQLRTFILRCYACFKTTSIMTKVFCPNCGNKTLKRVSVSLDENGQQKIHINLRKPLTARGKKFSIPTPKGGKHSQNPILCEGQRVPQQRVTKQARIKNDPLDSDYIAGYSPFVTKDTNSRSAMLGIKHNGGSMKHWMRKNPNEARRNRK